MRGRFFRLILITTAVGVLNSGCAAILSGSSSKLHVQSEEPDSKIYVDGEFIGTREGVIEVSKKDSPTITVHKDGCDDGKAVVDKEFDPVTLLGLLWDFGLISILVVDLAATGAVNKFKHTDFTVSPHCDRLARPQATAPREVSVCSKAFAGISQLADAWIEWHPGSDPQDQLPERSAFMSLCDELPEEAQTCLTLKYEKGHHDECTQIFDGLPARAKARLNRLFIRPASQ